MQSKRSWQRCTGWQPWSGTGRNPFIALCAGRLQRPRHRVAVAPSALPRRLLLLASPKPSHPSAQKPLILQLPDNSLCKQGRGSPNTPGACGHAVLDARNFPALEARIARRSDRLTRDAVIARGCGLPEPDSREKQKQVAVGRSRKRSSRTTPPATTTSLNTPSPPSCRRAACSESIACRSAWQYLDHVETAQVRQTKAKVTARCG